MLIVLSRAHKKPEITNLSPIQRMDHKFDNIVHIINGLMAKKETIVEKIYGFNIENSEDYYTALSNILDIKNCEKNIPWSYGS